MNKHNRYKNQVEYKISTLTRDIKTKSIFLYKCYNDVCI